MLVTNTENQALGMTADDNDRLLLAREAARTEMEEETNERLLPPILLQYWHTALRWRWVLASIVGASIVIGLVVTLLMAPLFTARSQIEISRQQKKVTNVESVEATQSGQDLEFYATQYSLLKAVSLAQRVDRSLKLSEREAFFEAHGATANSDPALRRRQVVKLLLANVSIEPVRTSRLSPVSAFGTDLRL